MTTAATSAAGERDGSILASRFYRLATGVIIALGIVYAVTTLAPFDERPTFLDTWFYSTVLLLTAGLALARPLFVSHQRAAWLCIGLAVTSWAVGDIYWSAAFSSLDSADIPVPSLADVFYVGMYPLAYAGFVLLARSSVTRLPASVWLDGVVTSLAAGAVFSAATLKDILDGVAGGKIAETFTNLSYPIGDLVLLVITVAAMAMVRWRRDPVWWLLGLGAGLFAIADTAYLFGLAHDTYVDGSWVDGAWMLGLTLMAYAASMRRARQPEEVRPFTALLVPIVFSLAALIVLVVGTRVDLHPLTIAMAAGCLVAAGVRMALTFEQTRALARSQLEAKTDELSGLGNRRLLDDRLPALVSTVRPGSQLACTIIGIDHLSEINGTLGYPAGDAVLQAVGSRLRGQVPRGAVSARLGGVELAVLHTAGPDPAAAQRDVQELLTRLSDPVPADGVPVNIDLRAGIAFSPLHAGDGADLIRCASDALRRARSNGVDVEVYDPKLDLGREFGPRLMPDLLKALQTGEFFTYYQPKVDLDTGNTVELEAVLRWHHPSRGVLGADVVLPLAARAGLTRQITRALLSAAVRECAAWRRRGVNFGVAVDVAAADVLDSRLPYDLARLINGAGLPPAALMLEIAEDVLLLDHRRTAHALGQFRAFGVRLALDHYGRSAPSLTRLRTLPVDELKLDGSFLAPVLHSPQDSAVVRSTVELARSLRIRTVADGVDSRELYEAALSFNCSGVQGTAVGEPIPPHVLPQWIEALTPHAVSR